MLNWMNNSFIISLVLFIFFFSFFNSNSRVDAWGATGHSLTARIAMAFSYPNTTSLQKYLLPEVEGNLSMIASWADEVRHVPYPWSNNLHTAPTPAWVCNYDPERDCTDMRCVDTAIQNYTHRLANVSLNYTQRVEAIKFLVHFIGDLHQPLHEGFKEDSVGTAILGQLFGLNGTLHEVWDSQLIDHRINRDFKSDPTLFFYHLIELSETRYRRDIEEWRQCSRQSNETDYSQCSYDWAQESVHISCFSGYIDEKYERISEKTGYDMGDMYYYRNIEYVERRLLMAGVRMAHVMNRITEKMGAEEIKGVRTN